MDCDVRVESRDLALVIDASRNCHWGPCQRDIKAGEYPAVIGDFNNDGELDLVVGGTSPAQVTIMTQP